LAIDFVELDDWPARLAEFAPIAETTMVCSITDGIRYYRGSSISALSRLAGFAHFGSTATAQHLCQDKFASLALAASAGLRIAPTRLMQGGEEIAALGDGGPPYFVKPNTLGAKIGIFADSRCATFAEARERCARLWERYRDRALIQPFLPGDDVRVSFLDGGGEFAQQLGVDRLRKDPASETGGEFMTMKDNETLSGARDTRGARGGFGAVRAAAFTPAMTNLKAAPDASSRRSVGEITDMAARLARLVGLRDLFSMDFRVDAEGQATFLEFEVCPGITIYDFQNYLSTVHGLGLGDALAKSFLNAFARARAMGEA